MKNNWKARKSGRLDENQRKLLGALIIPAIIIVLILVIVVVDRTGKKEPEITPSETVGTVSETMQPEETPAETEPIAETTVPEETEETDAYETENFVRDSVPEILTLLKSYFNARANADAEAMNQLYGIGEISVTSLEEQKTKMRNNSKYVTGFEQIATYVKPGTTTDSWLVYATADIKFRSVKTAAPMIMWCYVTKDAEGNYQLSDNSKLPAEILAYADAANRTEEVRRLAIAVNERLKEALSSDEELNSVYGILNADSPIWIEEGAQETEAEVKILGADSSEIQETTPETTSETTPETAAPETVAIEPTAENQPTA